MINAVNFTSTNTQYKTKKDQSPMQGSIKPVKPPVKPVSPLKSSLSTTAAWFGFGVVLDRVTTFAGKYIKTSPLKTSIITNGVIALGAGAYTFIKENSTKNKKASA